MLTLAGAIAERGYAVDLVVAGAAGPLRTEVPAFVRLIDLGCSRVLASLPGLVRYLRKVRPDGLLSTLAHANLVALWAGRIARIPVRIVIREATTTSQVPTNAVPLRSRLVPYLVRRFYPAASAIVAVSEGVAADLVQRSGLPQGRVEVIYNPVISTDLLARAEQQIHHPWFAPDAPPVILSVGRLTRAKDYPTLIRAFSLVRKKRKARLMILGEGEERGRLELLVRSLGMVCEVDLPGFVPNPFPYMRKAAVFALSSAWEGLPNALIQALALGTPVVATDCKSGPREVLQGGFLGDLVPVGKPELMADAIGRTLLNPRQTERKGLERFHRETITEAYLGLILGDRAHG